MTRHVAVLALMAAVAATTALAQKQPAPFAAGDAKAGKAIVERDCVSCHAASVLWQRRGAHRQHPHRTRTATVQGGYRITAS